MNRVEEMLRNELRSPGYELLLDSDHVLGGVRRRRRRQDIVAAAVAVVVVIGLGWVGVTSLDHGVDRTAPPAGDPSPTPIPSQTPNWQEGNHFIGIRFVSADRGHAVVFRCKRPNASNGKLPCRYRLGSTTDGGKSWHFADGPRFEFKSLPPRTELHVFADSIVIDHKDQDFDHADFEPPNSDPIVRKRWYTRDDGRTWQERSPDPQGSVDAVPSGAHVGISCERAMAVGRVECKSGGFVALLSDGSSVWLGGGVPHGLTRGDLDPYGDVHTGADGSVWYSTDSHIGASWVAVSRDRGRSWKKTNLPAPGQCSCTAHVDTRDGVTAYALVSGPDLVFRTADGGKTWHKLSVPPPGPYDPATAMNLMMTIAPDGGVFVGSTMTPLHRSRPDGTGFVRVRGAPGIIPQWRGARLVIGDAAGGGPTHTSVDGKHWQKLRLE
jgi:hypothetical protein